MTYVDHVYSMVAPLLHHLRHAFWSSSALFHAAAGRISRWRWFKLFHCSKLLRISPDINQVPVVQLHVTWDSWDMAGISLSSDTARFHGSRRNVRTRRTSIAPHPMRDPLHPIQWENAKNNIFHELVLISLIAHSTGSLKASLRFTIRGKKRCSWLCTTVLNGYNNSQRLCWLQRNSKQILRKTFPYRACVAYVRFTGYGSPIHGHMDIHASVPLDAKTIQPTQTIRHQPKIWSRMVFFYLWHSYTP